MFYLGRTVCLAYTTLPRSPFARPFATNFWLSHSNVRVCLSYRTRRERCFPVSLLAVSCIVHVKRDPLLRVPESLFFFFFFVPLPPPFIVCIPSVGLVAVHCKRVLNKGERKGARLDNGYAFCTRHQDRFRPRLNCSSSNSTLCSAPRIYRLLPGPMSFGAAGVQELKSVTLPSPLPPVF